MFKYYVLQIHFRRLRDPLQRFQYERFSCNGISRSFTKCLSLTTSATPWHPPGGALYPPDGSAGPHPPAGAPPCGGGRRPPKGGVDARGGGAVSPVEREPPAAAGR
eukprot:864402-Prorocentrum_minimum.AAC.1